MLNHSNLSMTKMRDFSQRFCENSFAIIEESVAKTSRYFAEKTERIYKASRFFDVFKICYR